MMKKISTLLFVVGVSFVATTLFAQSRIVGEGPVVKKTINVTDFEKIGFAVHGRVILKQGSYHVEVEGQANIIEALNKDVENGKWNIGFENHNRVKNYKDLTFHITMPTIAGIGIAGGGEFSTEGQFTGLGSMDFSIAGSGDIQFAGDAETVKISIAGSGAIKAESLTTKDCKVSIAGSGDCFIGVSDNLKVSIAGSGNVRYKGEPSIKTSIAGSGNVSSM